MVSDTGLLPWYERMRAEVPDPDVFDVHTHIGANDPDGFSCTRAELVDYLRKELTFPDGVFLMTGTGLVPPDDFSLEPGDQVRITIGELTLENPVGR